MKPTIPQWLTPQARKIYREYLKALPNLNALQADLAAMLANEYDVYLAANAELQAHREKTGRLSVPGSAGNIAPHPAAKIAQSAHAAFVKCYAQLRMSLGNEVESEVDQTAALDQLALITGGP